MTRIVELLESSLTHPLLRMFPNSALTRCIREALVIAQREARNQDYGEHDGA